jgi:hypothetical protein
LRFPLFILAALLISVLSYGQILPDGKQQFKKKTPSYHIYRTNEKITIDGRLDEATWQRCQVADSFYENYPSDTSFSTAKTEARLTFDDNFIYVSAVCYESREGEHVIYSLRRDFAYANNDAFAFYIDPARDKTNGFGFGLSPLGVQREGIISGGGGFGTNGAWDNKWFSAVSVEPGRWVLEMAIPFKTIRYKPDNRVWGMNLGRQDLKLNENTSWSPVQRNVNLSSLLFAGELIWEDAPPPAGLNISAIPYVRADLNHFPLAGEPDQRRSQAITGGADFKIGVTSSLNLDVTVNPDFSETDVDEQVINLERFSIFFPEKRTFFQENSDLFENFGFTHIRPFFSRRIGLDDQGRIVPILVGARLSGKLNNNWRIGVMDMQTRAVDSFGLPGQNYGVAAVQRQIGQASNISAIMVNKQAYASGFAANSFNRLAGLDYNFATPDNTFRGKAFFHYSFSPQQKEVTPYAHATWLTYLTRRWEIDWNHEYVGQDYNAEVGFVPRHNYWRLEPSASLSLYPKKGPINRWGPSIYNSLYTNQHFRVTDNYIGVGNFFDFNNTSSTGWNLASSYILLTEPFDPSGIGQTPHPAGPYHNYDLNIYYQSDFRKHFNWQGSVQYGTYFSGHEFQYGLLLAYRWQPWVVINLNAERYEFRFPAPYQNTALTLIGPKFDVSFSRTLFLTTWVQYNEQLKNVNVNTRLQWRFRPMSDLFIVYNRNTSSNDIALQNENLIVKLNWWLNL